MNKRLAIEIAKFVGAVAIGVTVGAVTRPAVNEFFKLKKTPNVDTIPSEDIEEAELADNE